MAISADSVGTIGESALIEDLANDVRCMLFSSGRSSRMYATLLIGHAKGCLELGGFIVMSFELGGLSLWTARPPAYLHFR